MARKAPRTLLITEVKYQHQLRQIQRREERNRKKREAKAGQKHGQA